MSTAEYVTKQDFKLFQDTLLEAILELIDTKIDAKINAVRAEIRADIKEMKEDRRRHNEEMKALRIESDKKWQQHWGVHQTVDHRLSSLEWKNE